MENVIYKSGCFHLVTDLRIEGQLLSFSIGSTLYLYRFDFTAMNVSNFIDCDKLEQVGEYSNRKDLFMIGAHLSLSPCLTDIVNTAIRNELDTFQIFIRNNRNMKRRSFTTEELGEFGRYGMMNDIKTIGVHAAYSLNPATADADKSEKYRAIVQDDLNVLHACPYRICYVLHPGSAVDMSYNDGLNNLCGFVRKLAIPNNVTLCLEFMAGAGSQLLRSPSDIVYVISTLGSPDNIKICFDTCHVFAAGFDPLETLKLMRSCIGIIHLNDSANPAHSFKDRHANIGRGYWSDFPIFLQWCAEEMPEIPVILETPESGFYEDVQLVKKYYKPKTFL